jgi:hypothetical protein
MSVRHALRPLLAGELGSVSTESRVYVDLRNALRSSSQFLEAFDNALALQPGQSLDPEYAVELVDFVL